MTSCFTSRSISSIRSTLKIAPRPFSQMVRAASFGITPSSAILSAAWASISNMMVKRVWGSQMLANSGRV